MPKKSIYDRIRFQTGRAARMLTGISGAGSAESEEVFQFESLPFDLKAEIALQLVANVRATSGSEEIKDLLHFLGASRQTHQLARSVPEIRMLKGQLDALGETIRLAKQTHETAIQTRKRPMSEEANSAQNDLLSFNNIVAAAPTFKTLTNTEKSEFIKNIFKRGKSPISATAIEEIVANPDYINHISQEDKEAALVSIVSSCLQNNTSGNPQYGNSYSSSFTEILVKSIKVLREYSENISSNKQYKKLITLPYIRNYLDLSPAASSVAHGLSRSVVPTAHTNEQLKQDLGRLANASAQEYDDGRAKALGIHEIGVQVAKKIDSQRNDIMNTKRPRDRSSRDLG